MIRLIYNLFPKQFNKILAEQQKLSFKDIEMNYSFTTLDGTMYYTFGHAKDMHASRYLQLREYMRMLGHQITDDELATINETAIAALEYSNPKTGFMQPKIGLLGLIHHEIKNRKDNILNHKIVYGIIALLNMSQKEIDRGGAFDKVTHENKIQQFLKDNETEPLAGFFLRSGLSIYLPSIDKLKSELKEYTESTLNTILQRSEAHLKAFQETLNNERESLGLSVGNPTLKNAESTQKMSE